MRVLRGCVALGLLAVLVVGVPWLLIVVGQAPEASGWREVVTLLLRPGDGRLLLAVVTAVAWLAWLVFTLSVLVEVLNALTHHRGGGIASGPRAPIRLPGLGVPQAVAAGLVLAVLAMVTAAPVPAGADPPTGPEPSREPPTSTSTAPTATAPTPANPAQPVPSAAAPTQAQQGPQAESAHVHTVASGDDLWTLAERYYGDGLDWRRIADANPEVLTGGPDELVVGWGLRIPGVAAADGPTVQVQRGDTLATLADGVYGDADQWPRIQAANPELVTDPDHIEPGWRLRVPPVSTTQPTSDEEPTREESSPQESTPEGPPAPEEPSTPPVEPTPAPTAPAERPAERPVEPTAEPVQAGLAPLAVPIGLAALGGLLAAGLVTGLASRREFQLRGRPVGRRIVHPQPAAQAVEADLGRRAEPATLASLDRALRAIDVHCRDHGLAPPEIVRVAVEDAGLVFDIGRAMPPPPSFVGQASFAGQGRRWWLSAEAAEELSDPGASEDAAEYPRTTPALVCVGVDAADRTLLVDLEQAGVLAVEAPSAELAESAVAALAMELSFSYWSDQLRVTLVGGDPGLVGAVAQDHLQVESDVDAVLERLAARAERQRAEAHGRSPATHRLDPERAEAWASEVVLFDVELRPEQEERLTALLTDEPSVALAAVLGRPSGARTAQTSSSGTRLVLIDEHRASLAVIGSDDPARAQGDTEKWEFRAQLVDGQVRRALRELVSTTASAQTTPAPWWDPAPVTPVPRSEESAVHPADVAPGPETASVGPEFPTLLLLGPVELVGTRGTPPSRAPRQCLEYCAWLLERPGGTAPMMGQALAVAEGTRRSNMSRLRTWLGEDTDGSPFLPDAYSGRISLHPQVSSDWQRLQLLITGGINRAPTGSLAAALDLVRGAPLADAAPGQWHWAEELRTDMASVVRDIGVELADRALADGDLELARWAANRALTANPADELLMCARIRTEHRAGRTDEVERLVRTVAAQARALQVDLADETIDLMQQVMEGRPRRD